MSDRLSEEAWIPYDPKQPLLTKNSNGDLVDVVTMNVCMTRKYREYLEEMDRQRRELLASGGIPPALMSEEVG